MHFICDSIDEMTTTSTSSINTSAVPSYLYESSGTEVDPNQYEYKWSSEIERERSFDAGIAVKNQMIENLLRNATLTEQDTYVYSKDPKNPDKYLSYCMQYSYALKNHQKMYPVQGAVWPYLKSGHSSILIGNTDFYPHLLYLPPIFDLVQASYSSL